MIIQYAILIMSCLDLLLTYNYISTFRKIFPKNKNWIQLEANPVLRACMKQYGLGKGTFIGGIGILVLLSLLVFIVLDHNLLWYLSGVFTMMILYHFANWTQLQGMKVKK